MCTVSFVYQKNQVIITSNRDEHISRPQSLAPQIETIQARQFIYPKDALAGGTWIMADDRGVILVLLNGAFLPHVREANYRKSRGLIVKELIQNDNPANAYQDINLENIEPFTLIIYQDQKLVETRWDGTLKHIKELDSRKNYIWSSSTLYPKEWIDKREEWFQEFIQKYLTLTPEDMIYFHTQTEIENQEFGLIIRRANGMQTFSVTQIVTTDAHLEMNYMNVKAPIPVQEKYLLPIEK